MDIVDAVAETLMQQLDIPVNKAAIRTAVRTLLGDAEGRVDVMRLSAEIFTADAGNTPAISPVDLMVTLGEDKVEQFSRQLGIDTLTAASGMSYVLLAVLHKPGDN